MSDTLPYQGLPAWGLIALATAVFCAILARRRGYSALTYACLGLLLGPGALPLTRAVTGEELQTEEWPTYYHNLRQRLCLFAVAIVGGSWVTLLLLAQFMLPWFREMFSGMSLAMPLPTRIFVTVSGWLNPAVMALGFASSLVLPQRLYRVLVSGYNIPALGPVWRRTDHLWLQHRQTLPLEVNRRLGGQDQDHQDESRDRLATEVLVAWSQLLPLAALAFFGFSLLLWGLLAPVWQLIGFIGG